MTPSQKLDTILQAGERPRIEQLIDCSTYKYVWRNHGGIAVGNWLVPMVYGMMSDGASGVPDRVHDAFWAHDRLYLSPWAYYKGVHKRVTRVQADLIYAQIAARRLNIIAVLHGLSLAAGVGRLAWSNYRKQDEAALIESHVVPHAHCWDFRTQYTRDAVWIG